MEELGALMLAVRDEIKDSIGRMSCIHAVGTLIDAAEAIGYKLTPLTVRVRILNPFLAERVGVPGSADFVNLMNTWSSHEEACQVHLGIGEAPRGEWAGHLVAVGDLGNSKRLILDPAIEQVNQSKYGIALMPLALRVDADRLRGEITSWFKVAGCGLWYSYFPDDDYFMRTTAWREERAYLCAGALGRHYWNGVG